MTLERMARTAWGSMQVHRYSPRSLAAKLGYDPDFTDVAHARAVLQLADRLAATWGDDHAAAEQARAAGFYPVAAYDSDWLPDVAADPTTPEGQAVELASRRWEIVRRMAEGLPTRDCLAGIEQVWCERSLQRFRTQHMTSEPSRYEAFQYVRDNTWLARAEQALEDPVGWGLRYGVIFDSDLPSRHPRRVLLAEQSRERRRTQARTRTARRHTPAVGEQLALAGM